MKFSLTWLKDHLDVTVSLDALEHAMTMAGLEVEDIDDPAARLAAFTLAHVVDARPHPDADRLRICQVDTRDGRKEIVCGAPNARSDMWVVYAPLGTYIPGADFSLDAKPRKIRGIESHGMLCSATELGVGEDSDGILDLKGDFTVGQSAAEALGHNDAVVDFEVTPNRPDWLGVRGVARDLAAAGLGSLKADRSFSVPAGTPCPIKLAVEPGSGCTFFAGRMIEGVKNVPSPEWLQHRLLAIGIKPRSALVDITNYLSIDRARPLHVYDADQLTGTIRARAGRDGETLEGLDGATYALSAQHCVIADDARVLGIGGVMGGTHSGCSAETTRVFVESAMFDPLQTLRTGRALAIQSDAQYRFARGVDPQSCLPGLDLATALILEICGGTASQIVQDGALPPSPGAIEFPLGEVARLTGLHVAPDEMARQLSALGCAIEKTNADQWQVTPPSWRADMSQKADIVEEIARLTGYDKLPQASLPKRPGRPLPAVTGLGARRTLLRRSLAQRGLHECVTFSFCGEADFARFGGSDLLLKLRNPISSALTHMRPSALPHLVEAARRNHDRGLTGIALFEVGPVYRSPAPDGQRVMAAGVRLVETQRHWQGGTAPDAYTVKDDVLGALAASGVNIDNIQIVMSDHGWWHPGRSGRIQLGPKTVLAEFGQLHPDVTGDDFTLVGFEIDLDAIPERRARGTAKPRLDASDLMPVRRDFAFVVKDTVRAGDLTRAIVGADKALIEGASVFDIYRGKGLGEDEKSVAVEVTLQPREATLDEKALQAVSAAIVKAAEKAVGARLR